MSDNNHVRRIHINDNCFDIIRLICTFTVFFGHFLTHFSIRNGVFNEIAYFVRGVPVFFFLSGLFIARSLEKYSTGEFFKRRLIRIFPELWVCVILNLVIILISLGGKRVNDIVIYLATQMTAFQFYTGSWLREYGVGTPNGALWTITVDIQFYLVAVFLAKWMKGRKIGIWGIAIALAMALDLALERGKSLYPEIGYKLLQCSLVPFIWIFLIGMCIYYNRDKLILVIVRMKWKLAALYLIWQYMAPGAVVKIFEGIRYNLITTLLMLLMMTGLGFSFKKRLKQDYSYSFYLYHMVVINFINHNICKEFNSTGQFVITFIGTIVIIAILAILSHRYIEEGLTKKIEKRLL